MSVPPTPQPRGGSPAQGINYYGNTGSVGAGLAQPGFNINTDGRGLLEGTAIMIYQVDPTLPRLPNVPQRGSPHPTDSRLKCYKVDSSFSNNGECRVTASYIGLEKDPTDPQLEITGSTSETSIVFHPYFADIAIKSRGRAATGGAKAVPPKYHSYVETDDQGNFVRFKIGVTPEDLGGVEAYLTPKATVRLTYYTGATGSVKDAQSGLGRANKKPGNFPNGLLGDTPANWLLTSCSVSEYGNVFKISEEYMLSESGKAWNKWIYGGGSSSGGVSGILGTPTSIGRGTWLNGTSARRLPGPAGPGNPA